MTPARALLVRPVEACSGQDHCRTLLEVQKLAYFLQAAGEPPNLKYEPGHCGPCALNLNKILEAMEGHFIRGYGDCQKSGTKIELLPGATEEATEFLHDKEESNRRLAAVRQLIEGFETPCGMELLATVHRVATQGGPGHRRPAAAPDEAAAEIRSWDPRRRKVFKPEHFHIAWEHLAVLGWIGQAASLRG